MRAKGFKRILRKVKRTKTVEETSVTDVATGEKFSVLEALANCSPVEPEPARTSLSDVSLAAAVEAMKKPQALSKTHADYERAWGIERAHRYKVMDALEERFGHAIDKDMLDSMARVMACPIKRNPPNWQHGRLVYALARHRIAQGGEFVFLDIGTAKGFSACCMALAVFDHDPAKLAHIWSVDTIDPASTAPRNSMMDDLIKRGIWDYCERFIPEAMRPMVHFVQDGDTAHIGFLSRTDRIGFAFVDGDHSYHGVRRDIINIVPRQQKGDIILFDDWNLESVSRAIFDSILIDGGPQEALKIVPEDAPRYTLEIVNLIPSRSYAIAVRQ